MCSPVGRAPALEMTRPRFVGSGCRASHRAAARLDPGELPSHAQHSEAGCAGVGYEGGPSRGRGSQAPTSVASTRPTVPLDELARCSRTALRFVCCTRARSSPRPPATPGAGPPNIHSEVFVSARPPRQSLPFGPLGGTSFAGTPTLATVGGPLAAAVAPAVPSRRRQMLGPSRCAVAAR
jgi:hypothetical protein